MFNFNGGVTGNALADFLLGRAFTYDIRATSRLTLNDDAVRHLCGTVGGIRRRLTQRDDAGGAVPDRRRQRMVNACE